MPFRYMALACSILASGALAMLLTSFRVVLGIEKEPPGGDSCLLLNKIIVHESNNTVTYNIH